MERRELPDSTFDGLRDHPRGRGGRVAHRVAVLIMVALVLGGLLGLLGPRTGHATAEDNGYSLSLDHPAITRAGQPAELHLTVEREGGFDGPVTLSVCDRWFDDFDFHAWFPTPVEETTGPGVLVYEFDPPSGDVLSISLDAHTAPGRPWATEECEVAVLQSDVPQVSVGFTTWRLP